MESILRKETLIELNMNSAIYDTKRSPVSDYLTIHEEQQSETEGL